MSEAIEALLQIVGAMTLGRWLVLGGAALVDRWQARHGRPAPRDWLDR